MNGRSQKQVDEIIGVQEDLSAKIGVTIYVGMRPETYGYPADMPAEEKAACQKKVALLLHFSIDKRKRPCAPEAFWSVRSVSLGSCLVTCALL